MTRSTKFVLGRWLICTSVLAACVDKEGQGVGSATDATSSAITSVSDTASVDTDGAEDDTSATPTAPSGGSGDGATGGMDDTGSLPATSGEGATTGGSVVAGCQKVDLLFVIDNATTMGAEQQGLIAAFPGFYDAVKSTLGVADYHVMAVAADDGKSFSINNTCIGGDCSCGPAPICCGDVCAGDKNPATCNGITCAGLEISACASTYGAGRDHHGDGTFCDLAEGRRYMLSSQPDLNLAFECVANVGTYDALIDKRPMLAATEATGAVLNGPGGCDEGFMRDDALLVLVFVSDKDDANADGHTGSPGDPQQWYDAIVAAKGGNAGAVVTLGLVGDGNLAGGACDINAEPDKNSLAGSPAPRLQEFVGKFTHGAIGSVCAADYSPFFTSAITVIDQACDAM